MLRRLSNLAACYFKNYIYTRPSQVEWLKNKFQSNPNYADKLQYLSRLERQERLGNFFTGKPVQLLHQEQIYYLICSGVRYNMDQSRTEIMAKIQSTYFKCFVARQYRWISQTQQNLIVIGFNQQLFQLSPTQIVFCLETISQFPQASAQLDKNRLYLRVLQLLKDTSATHSLILITGHLQDIGIVFSELVNTKILQKWLNSELKLQFRAIYFLHRLAQKLGLKLSQAQLDKLKIKMKTAFTHLDFTYFENDYLVFLLKYYPQYVQKLNILRFSPRAYLGYLQFYKQNSQFKIIQHNIPTSVIQNTDYKIFRDIIEYRLALSLDNHLTLAKYISNLNPSSIPVIQGYLSFILENKISDLEVEFYLQKGIIKCLKLDKQLNIEEKQKLNFSEIFHLLAHLCRNDICSIDFWKKTAKFIEQIIEINQNKRIIQHKITTILNLILIVSTKNFKQETKKVVFSYLIGILSNSKIHYTMKQIARLSKILAVNRIGQDQIWLLMEKRVLMTYQQPKETRQSSYQQQNLTKIAISFNSIQKGSFKFWNMMNELLEDKLKKDILAKSVNNKLAKIHLKIKS